MSFGGAFLSFWEKTLKIAGPQRWRVCTGHRTRKLLYGAGYNKIVDVDKEAAMRAGTQIPRRGGFRVSDRDSRANTARAVAWHSGG